MKIYFGGDSFLYGYGLERKDSLPSLFGQSFGDNFLDDSQVESSNKLIYLRALNNLITDKSCDFYFIMWSRGIDRRFERILNYDLSERWVNIIPHPDNSKKDKIKNDINKFIFSNLVTDKSSFLNTFVYMISLQELFKLYNKKYLFSFANDDFLDFYLKYKNKFNIKVKPYDWEHSKETDFTSLIKRLNFDYIIEKPFSNFIDSDDLNRHPNENECKMFMEYLIGICDEMELL